MMLRIDRLDMTLPATGQDGPLATRRMGQHFAQALTRCLTRNLAQNRALADLVAGGGVQIDRLDLPPITARHGEGPGQLAKHVAGAIVAAIEHQRGAP